MAFLNGSTAHIGEHIVSLWSMYFIF